MTDEPINQHAKMQNESNTQQAEIIPNEWRSKPEYSQRFIIGNTNDGMKTRGSLKEKPNISHISQLEPKKVDKALKDSNWVHAMQEEHDQFDINKI